MTSTDVIIRGCAERCTDSNNLNWSNLYELDGEYYKILTSVHGYLSEQLFIKAMSQNLFVDGVFPVDSPEGFRPGSYTLYRLSRTRPEVLTCSDHLTADLTEGSWTVPSPYGETIPVNGLLNESPLDMAEITTVETAGRFNYHHDTVRNIATFRQGTVWVVDHLEYDNDRCLGQPVKNRPVIVKGVSGDDVSFYMCTTNNKQYDFQKVRIDNAMEDGFTRDTVYVELRSRMIPKNRLTHYIGMLSTANQKTVFNPPKTKYWNNMYKPVD